MQHPFLSSIAALYCSSPGLGHRKPLPYIPYGVREDVGKSCMMTNIHTQVHNNYILVQCIIIMTAFFLSLCGGHGSISSRTEETQEYVLHDDLYTTLTIIIILVQCIIIMTTFFLSLCGGHGSISSGTEETQEYVLSTHCSKKDRTI